MISRNFDRNFLEARLLAGALIATPLDRNKCERLAARRETTVAAYTLILRQFVNWVAERPGHQQSFHPAYLTKTQGFKPLCAVDHLS